MRAIPISAAKQIAELYGYDQVVVYARKVGEDPQSHGEHITTYGVSKVHCRVAGAVSKKLQRLMGWRPENETNA